MSAQDKLDRRAAKHGLGSDERKRKIQKAKDFFSKPVPKYSKDELRKMGHPVEATDAEVKKKQDFLDRLRGKPPVKKESSAEYGKSMDRIKDKEKNAAIKPKDRETLGKLADLMKKQKRNEAYRKPTQAEIDADKKKDGKSKDSSTRYRDMKKKMYGNAMGGLKNEEKMYSVKYTHPTDKKSGKTTGPLSKTAADKKAAMGNRVDRVGGKYTVIPHVEAAGQEYTANPVKTGDDWKKHHIDRASANLDNQKKKSTSILKQLYKDAASLKKESVSTADKKPQNFRDPETGKLKVRMVPVDRDVVRGDDKARVVRKKRFKHLRSK